MVNSVKLMCLLAIAHTLSACAGMSEQACLVSDWQTVGFEDGVAGRSVSGIGNYRQACGKHGITPDLESYRVGHSEGVEVYCRASNGFGVGHRGARYQGVCPAELEPEFLTAYNSGRHLYELESALRQIDNQIAGNEQAQQNIKQELTAIAASIAGEGTSVQERIQLVARAAELGRQHSELTNETKALEQQRPVHERELINYQQTLASGF